jgi:isopentenyl-diphosphate delta-isomerase
LENLDTKSLTPFITLVNSQDEIIGYEEKLKVHQQGLLHRAFSVLIFNKEGKALLHKRAEGKYHSPGLWTNTCCGHPNEGESNADAAFRRLEEEMGFQTSLTHQFTFRYRAEFENGLIENEIDHVYFGEYEGEFEVNPEEVSDYKWLSLSEIKKDIEENSANYTVWFKEIVEQMNQ